MVGGTDRPPAVSPAPSPVMGREVAAAKKTTQRRQGRSQNILAGRLNSQHGKILLGE